MRSYEERAKYILKQRDKRLEKRRHIRSAASISAAAVFSVAAVAGITLLVNRVGDKGAVLVSLNSAPPNSYGITDSISFPNGAPANLPPEKIYPRSNDDIERILEINDDFSFTMPEFPNDVFRLEKGILCKEDLILYSGQPIHSLYLADLNGDGFREICSDVSVGLSGVIDMHIVAFDAASDALYSLDAEIGSEYHITFEDGRIGYERMVYSSDAIVTDQKGELTLSVMSKQTCQACRKETEPESPIETLYRRGSSEIDNLSFAMPEYPDYSFELRDNKFFINGTETYVIGKTIESIILADLNIDGCREICFEAKSGWELGESIIVAIEYKKGEHREFDRRELGETGCCYTLAIDGEVLCYECRKTDAPYSTPKGRLTLDIMAHG